MADKREIRRALISVYDKTGIVEFARALHEEFGIELISTGGTAKVLQDAGLPVTLVEQVTGFPEMMDGRVKTLHPKIHAAILADRDNPEHMRQLAEQGIEPIDLVVVNLYPFEKTIARPDCTFEQAIEMIDIGGPCLLRAAAKNHKHVLVLSDPHDCRFVLSQMRRPTVTDPDSVRDWRRERAFYALWQTARYDAVIARWLGKRMGAYSLQAETVRLVSDHPPLRYGENPHQSARLLEYDDPRPVDKVVKTDAFQLAQLSIILMPDGTGSLSDRESLPISHNNLLDANAAQELCAELTRGMGDRPPVGHSNRQGPTPQDTDDPSPPGGGPTSGRSSPGRSFPEATTDERSFRRHLPHIERPDAVYFVTFRLKSGQLSPAERDRVLEACRHWHGQKMTLHCASVMPDHVHLLLTPYEPAADRWVPLGELLKSIKNFSAREVNKLRGTQGSLWLDENFDRIIRSEADFFEKWEYIVQNPVTAELVSDPDAYPWFWQSGIGYGELAEPKDRPEVGPPSSTRPPTSAGPLPTDRPEVGPPLSSDPGIPVGTQSGVRPPAVCFIKHTNACGAAVQPAVSESDEDVTLARLETYRKAYLGDPNAAMGGILAVNFNVDAAFAETVMNTYQAWGKDAGAGGFFVEVWLAPSFDDDAIEKIRTLKPWGQRVRLLAVGDMSVEPDATEMDFKRIAGGVLMQSRDLVGLNEEDWQVVTERQPTEQELDDLRLAWLVCKHTKSNAITVCKDGMLLGNGAGQMSRVMSCRIATWLATENNHDLHGAVAASDAFFPFRDGPDILADAGVSAFIQPGGSKRDEDTIAACNERGLAMIFTGTRHFKH